LTPAYITELNVLMNSLMDWNWLFWVIMMVIAPFVGFLIGAFWLDPIKSEFFSVIGGALAIIAFFGSGIYVQVTNDNIKEEMLSIIEPVLEEQHSGWNVLPQGRRGIINYILTPDINFPRVSDEVEINRTAGNIAFFAEDENGIRHKCSLAIISIYSSIDSAVNGDEPMFLPLRCINESTGELVPRWRQSVNIPSEELNISTETTENIDPDVKYSYENIEESVENWCGEGYFVLWISENEARCIAR